MNKMSNFFITPSKDTRVCTKNTDVFFLILTLEHHSFTFVIHS